MTIRYPSAARKLTPVQPQGAPAPPAATQRHAQRSPRPAGDATLAWEAPDGAQITVDLHRVVSLAHQGGPVFYSAIVRDEQGSRNLLVRREEVERRLRQQDAEEDVK